MSNILQEEVDANFKAFQELLPSIITNERNRWALMKNRECVAFYDTFRDAKTAGDALYDDGIFSIQEVTGTSVDLGWFSHALH